MGDTGGNGDERPFLRCPGISRGCALRYRVGGRECVSECVCTYSLGVFLRGVPIIPFLTGSGDPCGFSPTALDLRPDSQRSVDAWRPLEHPIVATIGCSGDPAAAGFSPSSPTPLALTGRVREGHPCG